MFGIHWVVWGTGTPKDRDEDRDEVDKRKEICVYFETRIRELKIRPTYCRCNERLKTKGKDSTRLGYTGRKKCKTSIWSHGHNGDTRPGQTRKTPKDLSVHESEEDGRGESVGWYVIHLCGSVSEEGGDGEGEGSEAPSLLCTYVLKLWKVLRDKTLFIINR
jgi:hypothetical protein